MSDDVKFSMNVMISEDQTKVLLAEIDSDLADILLSFLTLPLGKIVSVLKNHYGDDHEPIIGSLNTLHNGLINLDSSHFWTNVGKEMLANPRSSFEYELGRLKFNVYDAQSTKYFTCGDWDCKKRNSPCVSMYHGSKCNHCSKSLDKEIVIKKSNNGGTDDYGVFNGKKMPFLISDDMQMMPSDPGSMIQILGNMGVTDINEAELEPVTIGFNEIIGLLKGVLLSKTPLTDLILNESHVAKSAPVNQTIGIVSSYRNGSFIVKAMIHKSTNKLLFIQSDEDFVDFLFSLLTIPLGGGTVLGRGMSCGSVDNFSRRVPNLARIKYMGLLTPMVPPKYYSDSNILSITDQGRELYYYSDYDHGTEFLSHLSQTSTQEKGSRVCFMDPKGGKTYLKRPGKFVVYDDLTILPASCMDSSFSILKGLKIPFCDVKEQELQIGMQEGLNILKACLTSTNALTNGLGSILYEN